MYPDVWLKVEGVKGIGDEVRKYWEQAEFGCAFMGNKTTP